MKLWILRPRQNLPIGDDPWEPWYDKCFGFVIRAASEDDARRIANSGAGDENQRGRVDLKPWLDAKYSTCEPLEADTEDPGIVICDFKSA